MKNANFRIEFNGTYIHVRHGPGYEISPENLKILYKELALAIRKYNCFLVLAEGTMAQRKMNMTSAFESADQIARSISGLKLALCLKGYKPDEITDFFKTVAYNRGIMIESFSDHEKALRWLGVSTPDEQDDDKSTTGGRRKEFKPDTGYRKPTTH